MRLTLVAFGLELDVTFGVAGAAEVEDDGPRDMGYTTSTPVGFVAQHEVPAEIPYIERNPGWGDEGN